MRKMGEGGGRERRLGGEKNKEKIMQERKPQQGKEGIEDGNRKVVHRRTIQRYRSSRRKKQNLRRSYGNEK